MAKLLEGGHFCVFKGSILNGAAAQSITPPPPKDATLLYYIDLKNWYFNKITSYIEEKGIIFSST